MKEEFRSIAGYEELYQVSNLGNVRSLNYNHTGQTRVMKLKKDRYGYLILGLRKNGKKKFYTVHRLVATAFIDNPDNLPCINHKDEDKTNNHVDNLEWCSIAYNNCYGTHNQLISEAMTNGKRSKKVLQLTLDYTLVKEWPSTRECGRNGFCQRAIWACCNNKYGKQGNVYKGFRWVYAEDYHSFIGKMLSA